MARSTGDRGAAVARSCDVAIIGAGLCGLHAASLLAADGVDVVVLEAQQRVGGRTLTVHLDDGAFIDHGGQWVSPGQPCITALAQKLGVALFPSWEDGLAVDWSNGARTAYGGLFPPGEDAAEEETMRVAAQLTEMAATVPLEAPWQAPEAVAWDRQTLHGWLRQTMASARGRDAIARAIEGVFASGPGETSLLAALYTVRSHGSLEAFTSEDPGPELRFDGGAQQLCLRLAERLADRVVLGAWVHHLDQSQGTVAVASDSAEIKAKQVIVTLPPALAGRLRYTPAVPMARDHLTQRAAMGWVTKVHCVYPDRFWRTDGLSGQISSDEGAVRVCADNSPPAGSPGILVGFIEGEAAQRLALADPEERRAAVLAELERYFGPRAARPVAYLEKAWGDDAFARGPYGGYWKPGLWTALGSALRPPHGAVHWAGAETSPLWNGKMEGALLSAERVATEVLASLA